MPSHQFSGKSKEELVFVAQLSGLLSKEAASKMTKSALLSFLIAEDEKSQQKAARQTVMEDVPAPALTRKRTSTRKTVAKPNPESTAAVEAVAKPVSTRGRKPRVKVEPPIETTTGSMALSQPAQESVPAPEPVMTAPEATPDAPVIQARRTVRRIAKSTAKAVEPIVENPVIASEQPLEPVVEITAPPELPVKRKPGRKKASAIENQAEPVVVQETAPAAPIQEQAPVQATEEVSPGSAPVVSAPDDSRERKTSSPIEGSNSQNRPRSPVQRTGERSPMRPENRRSAPYSARPQPTHRERATHLPNNRTPFQHQLIPAHHRLITPDSQPPFPEQPAQDAVKPVLPAVQPPSAAPLKDEARVMVPSEKPVEQRPPVPDIENRPEPEQTSHAAGDHAKVRRPFVETGELVAGVLEIMPDGYGFLRKENYLQGSNDIYVPPQYIRRFNLRPGDWVVGPGKPQRETDRYQALLYIKEVNGLPPDQMIRRPQFDKLTPIYPEERFVLETVRNELSTRIIDLVAPIGKGQRGMIVSPPKAGKTILLQKIANAISINNPDSKLIVLLIDERPEEVTDMQRSINGEVVYSTFDKTPENHVKVTELVLERAMRLVELKQDVVILLDSITRMGRAYNLTINPTGRTLSGGLDPGALYGPKRFFGAARNIEGGGSLTIVATALIDTGSRMDEVIFEEFKGTGNMEVYLDRKLSEKRIFPAIDINRSGTRREELLLTSKELDAVWAIRKAFGQLDTASVTEMIINLLLKTSNNQHFVSSVNVSLNDKNVFEAMRGNRTGAQAQGQSQNGYGG